MGLVALLLTTTPSYGCPGDCDRDCRVDVAEIIVGIRVALGEAAVAACRNFDLDDSGSVAVDELLTGVQAALTGYEPAPVSWTPKHSDTR